MVKYIYMALNFKLIKRFTNTTTSDVAHSTGYANAQNAGNFGTANGGRGNSFEERQALEKNRQNIQAYNRSKVAQQTNFREKALTFEEEMALAEAKKAINNSDDDYLSKREALAKMEAGGLRKYDKSNDMSGSAEVSKTRGYGRTSAAELRENRMAAASHRKAQAERFAGGVKTYQGGPQKFSGGTGIRPRNPSR